MSAADLYNNTKNQPVFGIAGEDWPFANFVFFCNLLRKLIGMRTGTLGRISTSDLPLIGSYCFPNMLYTFTDTRLLRPCQVCRLILIQNRQRSESKTKNRDVDIRTVHWKRRTTLCQMQTLTSAQWPGVKSVLLFQFTIYGAQTKRPKTKRPKDKTSQETKRPREKTSQRQNVPRENTSHTEFSKTHFVLENWPHMLGNGPHPCNQFMIGVFLFWEG